MIEGKLRGIQINVTTFSDGKYITSLSPVEVTKRRTYVRTEDKGFDCAQDCIASVQNLSSELLKEIDDAIVRPAFSILLKKSEHYFLRMSERLAGKIYKFQLLHFVN
jgi:phosphoribosylamine-glycine ligase